MKSIKIEVTEEDIRKGAEAVAAGNTRAYSCMTAQALNRLGVSTGEGGAAVRSDSIDFYQKGSRSIVDLPQRAQDKIAQFDAAVNYDFDLGDEIIIRGKRLPKPFSFTIRVNDSVAALFGV